MGYKVLGLGWVSGGGWGMGRGKGKPDFSVLEPRLPPLDGLFPKTPARWGRFDGLCRFGSSAAALALKDSGLWPCPAEGCGMVVGTRHETGATDRDFYRGSLDEGGALASPNLFSYTLPVIVLGECAVVFRLMGPAFCVGDSLGGGTAVESAGLLLDSGAAPLMLVAWADNPPADSPDPKGALCAVLEADPKAAGKAPRSLMDLLTSFQTGLS